MTPAWQPVDAGPDVRWPLWQRFAVEPGSVLVPPGFVRWLATKIDFNRLRDEARTDPEAFAVLVALRAAELTPASAVALPVAAGCGPSDCVERSMSAAEVAELVGVSGAAVRRAAAERRVLGQLVAGRWWFDAGDVDAWIERRRTA